MYILNIYLLFSLISGSYSQCVQKKYNFKNLDGLKIDYNAPNVKNINQYLYLELTKSTGGTRITLNNKLHYGSVEAMIKVSPGSNIVSSFILMADNGDEIDFEFVGKDQTIVQTNYFYKGIPIYDKNAKFYNTFKDLTKSFNLYKIIWTPDYYQWLFNNNVLRTLYKNQTNNFPDSPSNIQFGIWLAQNSKWAGNGPNWSLVPFNLSIHHIEIKCNNIELIKSTSTHLIKSTPTGTKNTITNTHLIKPVPTGTKNIIINTINLDSVTSTHLMKPTDPTDTTIINTNDLDSVTSTHLMKPTDPTDTTIINTDDLDSVTHLIKPTNTNGIYTVTSTISSQFTEPTSVTNTSGVNKNNYNLFCTIISIIYFVL